MKKDTVEMLHKVYHVLEENNEIELLAELKQFVINVKQTERLLTRGGFIQDKNGKLLTAGDKVLYEYLSKNKKRGVLVWQDNGFSVLTNGNVYLKALSIFMEKSEDAE